MTHIIIAAIRALYAQNLLKCLVNLISILYYLYSIYVQILRMTFNDFVDTLM